ncbi:tetratricopeptide repeat protein [Lamprobacter modestohalophilus]|nr:tetratricopeptide repeat protein [Lamprobacter modestohalophilus]
MSAVPARADLLKPVDAALKRGDPAAALSHLAEAQQHYPDDLALKIKQASLLRTAQRLHESQALLQHLREAHPDHPQLLHESATTARVLGDLDASDALLDRLLAAQPQHRGALLARVDNANTRGDPIAALEHLAGVLAHYPDDLALKIKQASLLRTAQRFQESQALLQHLREAHPDHPQLLHESATTARVLGDLDASDALLDRLLAAQPRHRGGLIARVDNANMSGDRILLRSLTDGALANLSGTDTAPNLTDIQLCLRYLTHTSPALEPERWAAHCHAVGRHLRQLGAGELWNFYRLCDAYGEQLLAEAAMERLLDLKQVPYGTAIALAQHLHSLDDPTLLQALVERLRNRVPPQFAAAFDLETQALLRGVAHALQHRRREAPATREMLLALSRLLIQLGRLALATRFLGRASRARPWDQGLLSGYIASLISAGEAPQAKRLLVCQRPLAEQASTQQRQVLLQVLTELGEHEAAEQLVDELLNTPTGTGLLEQKLKFLARRGDIDGARTLLATPRFAIPSAMQQRHRLQFSPSLVGAELTELEMAHAGGCADPDSAQRVVSDGQYLYPAIATIQTWIGHSRAIAAQIGPSAQPIPSRVMQYWNEPEPPPDIVALMQSWQHQRGTEYQSFNRRTAMAFLREHLDISWLRAFTAARHPAEESDYFRLCYLMVRGGIYADTDDRLLGNVDQLIAGQSGLVVFTEPYGAIGNNLIMASPGHPMIIRAAIQAKQGLLHRDNDGTWSKTGPGLLTRAIAEGLELAQREQQAPDLTIKASYLVRRLVQTHVPLQYKKTTRYWNNQRILGHLAGVKKTLLQAIDGPDHSDVAH